MTPAEFAVNRDELMGVIASAIFDYGREIYPGDGNLGVAEVILDAVEPLIRAEYATWGPTVPDNAAVTEAYEAGRADLLADLRRQVEKMPAHAVRMEYEWVNGAGWVSSNKVIDTLPVAAVLALLDDAMPPSVFNAPAGADLTRADLTGWERGPDGHARRVGAQ